MVEITNRDALEAWLKDKPREVAVAIAARSALRVAPYLTDLIVDWPDSRNLDDDLTSWLRCMITSVVAVKRLTPEITSAAIASYFAAVAGDVGYAAYDGGAGYGATAEGAAIYAATAAGHAATAAGYTLTANADAAVAHADSAFSAAFWEAIALDCTYLDRDDHTSKDVLEVLLWIGDVPVEVWDIVPEFLNYLNSKSEMEFWCRWYRSMTDSPPMNWDMQKEIVLIPNEDWKKGAVHVYGLIAEIEARYAAEALPLAEDLLVDEAGFVFAEPVPMPEGDVYGEVLDSVSDALEDALNGANNALKAEDLEAIILTRSMEKYREKPYRVHQDFTIVRDNLRQKLADGVFPEDHPPVVNLIRSVDDGAVNIRRAIPRVRETVAANARIRLAEATPEEREQLMAALVELESISREDFAQDVAADREEIAEPVSEATEVDAVYRSGSRLAKLWAMTKTGAVKVTVGLGHGLVWATVISSVLRMLGL